MSILIHKHGLLFGVSISDNENVTNLFAPTLTQALEESVIHNLPGDHWQKIDNILDCRNETIDLLSVSNALFKKTLLDQASPKT